MLTYMIYPIIIVAKIINYLVLDPFNNLPLNEKWATIPLDFHINISKYFL